MPEFDPDAPVKHDALHALSTKQAQIRWLISDFNRAKGFISWQFSAEDERQILKSFQYALAMVRTDCSDEWVVLGSGVFALVRTLDEFTELDLPEIACGLTYAGNIRRMRVYLLPVPSMPATEFIVGHYDAFVRGMCLNMPVSFGDEAPPRMDGPNDDEGEDPCGINRRIDPHLYNLPNYEDEEPEDALLDPKVFPSIFADDDQPF
jgi:hypothetical protein